MSPFIRVYLGEPLIFPFLQLLGIDLVPRDPEILGELIFDLIHDLRTALFTFRTLPIDKEDIVDFLSLLFCFLEMALHAIDHGLLVVSHWLHPLCNFLIVRLNARAIVGRGPIWTLR
jgi:hypothetical protein